MKKLKQYQYEHLEVGRRVRYQVPKRKIVSDPSACMGEFSPDMVNKDGTVLLEITPDSTVHPNALRAGSIAVCTYLNGYEDDARVVEFTIFFNAKMVRKGFHTENLRLIRAENIVGFPDDPTY